MKSPSGRLPRPPALQTIPIRTEEGSRIRDALIVVLPVRFGESEQLERRIAATLEREGFGMEPVS